MPSKRTAPKPAAKPVTEPETVPAAPPAAEPEESGMVTVTREVNGHRLSTTGSSKAEANRTLDAYAKAHNL
ncbi:hypothetical protein [Deinococcus humi]|uniref:Uncharacterized protein n=1 Tax=Deinococcus humi TaxID=662880 RepID=A0A7W8JQF9_9DEIO|nr:hypothetical protein [Deinococcus humi]MBB5361332.1 hypothetical protein [Deinococcus humi]GGO19515.1 hypothetical protein GCM10008949_03960 [Deinococcus humi]